MKMTGRERIMCALNHGVPDRIPATPDISIMIPTKLSGKAFYDPIDLTTAYIRAARYFGIDGWMFNGWLNYKYDDTCRDVTYETKIIKDTYEIKEYLTIMHTPEGDLTSVTVAPRDAPSTCTVKFIKDIKEQHKFLKYFFPGITGYDKTPYLMQKEEMQETGMICCFIGCPGLHSYYGFMALEELTYAYYDYPEIFDELREKHDKICVRQMEFAAEAGVESILTGGSGAITLQSPEIFRKMSLPTIKTVTKIAKEAGIISGIHSCGKEYSLVEMCANETDLDYVNPLEILPHGDCELAGLKQKFGKKLALMGNLHTSDVMLGSVDTVRLESLRAIRDAGENGGFVLSTGDQCGYNTPYENIIEIVNVAKEFGSYPLDIDRIDAEIKRLGNLFHDC
jgi:uroporphyrinogen decarboxylase